MGSSPRLTVAVIAYQVEAFIDECLQSIVSQTGTFEILCVDDASTDGTSAILADYARRYPELRIITHTENAGTYRSRVDAALAASGELITYVDGDDMLAPGACEHMLRLFDENEADCVTFAYRCFAPGADNDPLLKEKLDEFNRISEAYSPCRLEGTDIPRHAFVDGQFPRVICCKIMRTEDVKKAGELPLKGRYRFGEDQFFCFRYMTMCHSAVYVREPLYLYRLGAGISTDPHCHTLARFEQITMQLPLLRLLKDDLNDRHMASDFREPYEHFLSHVIETVYAEWSIMRGGEDKAASDRLIRKNCLPEMAAYKESAAWLNDKTARYEAAERFFFSWKGPFKKLGTLLFCLYRWGPGKTLRILMKKDTM